MTETPQQEHDRHADERRDAYPSLYCAMWPDLKAEARRLGYALLIHGSLKRDLDLVAVPWTAEAVGARTLADALKKQVGGWAGEVEGSTLILADKPHGRLGALIVCGGHAVIDLSIMPLIPTNSMPSMPPPPRCGEESAQAHAMAEDMRRYNATPQRLPVGLAGQTCRLLAFAEVAREWFAKAKDPAFNGKDHDAGHRERWDRMSRAYDAITLTQDDREGRAKS